MFPLRRFLLVLALLGAANCVSASASAAPVDLRTWTAESYPAVAGFGAGVWTVSPDGTSVFQSVNGQPTLFYSDFSAIGTEVRGRVRVSPGAGDDDFIGFALGFRPGDSTNPAADYLLVDWKRLTQFFDFGPPSTTPGTTALQGLAVSRVTGIPTADEFWGHTNFVSDPSGGLAELARGLTLGSTGWVFGQEYEFSFLFLADRLQVSVDGVPQLDISGSFSDGRLAFYNFSQASVTYSGFTVDPAGPGPVVPEPGSWVLFGAGVLGLLSYSRRCRQRSFKRS